MLLLCNFIMHRYFTMSDSSFSYSTLSSSDGLSFILEESRDDTPMLEYIRNNETDMKIIELLMKLKQARQEKIEKKHMIISTKTTSLKTQSTT